MADMIDDPPHVLSEEGLQFILLSNGPIPANIGSWKAYSVLRPEEDPSRTIRREIEVLGDCYHLYEDSKDYWEKRLPAGLIDFYFSQVVKCTAEGSLVVQK